MGNLKDKITQPLDAYGRPRPPAETGASISKIFQRWSRTAHMQLHAGEMTRGEVLAVKAVVAAIQAEVERALRGTGPTADIKRCSNSKK